MSNFKGISAALLTALVLLTSSCATQLAPLYDKALANGLLAVNKEMQVFFASIGNGATKNSYGQRKRTYDQIIGSLNALELQAKSRPIPSLTALTDANKVLRANGLAQLSQDSRWTDFPSARAIHDTSETMQHMRDADKKAGLRGGELKAFENQASTFLSQAITYEAFLKR